MAQVADFQVDRTTALYARPAMGVVDETAFAAVKSSIAESFSAARVGTFLKSLDRAGLRIRDFETVLAKGKLGAQVHAQYGQLPAADQGQIREFYLASLERVELELRDKFYKLYAYY